MLAVGSQPRVEPPATAADRQRAVVALLVALAALSLGTGLLVYLSDRHPGQAALLPAAAALGTGPLFGLAGGWLPSFVHPFAFSLLHGAARPASAGPAYRACAGWWGVNVAFELAQLPLLGGALIAALQRLPIPDALAQPLARYLLNGTFDAADLAAATAGALAAAAVLTLAARWESRHVA
jgi:hypothetical protein